MEKPVIRPYTPVSDTGKSVKAVTCTLRHLSHIKQMRKVILTS